MRKSFSLLFACLALVAGARQISSDEAAAIASEFLGSSTIVKKAVAAVNVRRAQAKDATRGTEDNQPYYIFNADDDNGFVIIAGDDRAKKIIGYSDTGNFYLDNMPPQLAAMLDHYAGQIAKLTADTADPSWSAPSRTTSADGSEEGVLLETANWGQGYPYNAQCPVIDGVQAPTGCVATAMAIVMKYHNWPEKGRYEYVYADNGIQREFSYPKHTWDWESFNNTLNDTSIENLASLFFGCGVSVEMTYGSNESSACGYLIGHALQQYFKMSPDCQYISKGNLSDENWTTIIQSQLNNNQPIIFSAQENRHAWVVDGYDNDNFYHCNWGWDGVQNGWFDISIYCDFYDGIVINITPDKSGKEYSRAWIDYGYGWGTWGEVTGLKVSEENIIKSTPFSVHAEPIVFKTPFFGEIGIALYENDEIIEIVDSKLVNFSYPTGYIYDSENIAFTKDVNAETGYLGLVTKDNSSETWLPVLGTMEGNSTVGLLNNKVEIYTINFTVDDGIRVYGDGGILISTGTSLRYLVGHQTSVTIFSPENNIESDDERILALCNGDLSIFNFKQYIWDSLLPSFSYVGGSIEGTKANEVLNIEVLKIVLNHDVVNITLNNAGTLCDLLPVNEARCIQKLAISGLINAEDIEYIRKNCISLSSLDLSNSEIKGCATPARTVEHAKKIGWTVSDIQPDNYFPDFAFDNFLQLLEIKFPHNLREIGLCALSNNYFQQIDIPAGVESIGLNAFDCCPNLWKVQVNNPVPLNDVGYCGFSQGPCYTDGVLYVPKGSRETYKNADVWGLFSQVVEYEPGQEGLIYVNYFEVDGVVYKVRGNNASIAAFTENANAICEIPDMVSCEGNDLNVTSCDSHMLSTLPNSVSELYLNDKIDKLSIGTFSENYNIEKIHLGNNILNIPKYCFRGCSNLKEVNLPSELREIEWLAFDGCNSLRALHIPAKVEFIGDKIYMGVGDQYDPYEQSVSGLYSLEYYSVDPDNNHFTSYNGCLYSTTMDLLYAVPGCFQGDFIVPETVQRLSAGAFMNCHNISSIKIPETVSFIPSKCFYQTRNLKSIEFSSPNLVFGRHEIIHYSDLSDIIFSKAVKSVSNETGYTGMMNEYDKSLNIFVLSENELNLSEIFNNREYNYYTPLTNAMFHADGGNVFIAGATSFLNQEGINQITEMWSYKVNRKEGMVKIEPMIEGIEIDRVAVNGREVAKGDGGIYYYGEADIAEIAAFSDQEPLDVVVDYTLHGRQAMTTHYDAEFNAAIPDDIITGVSQVSHDEAECFDIYNLQGICVKHGATRGDVDNLASGVYIVNGQKVIVGR